jgi:general secretion pathway protein D
MTMPTRLHTVLTGALLALAALPARAQVPVHSQLPLIQKPNLPQMPADIGRNIETDDVDDPAKRKPTRHPPPPPPQTGSPNPGGPSTSSSSGRNSGTTTRGANSTGSGKGGISPAATDDDNGKRSLSRDQIQRKGKFKLSFDKVDIEELVKQVSDMTGKMFILPDNIRGKITIIGPQHGETYVTADEVYAAFLSALDANNLAVTPTGKFLRIGEKGAAKQGNIPTFVDDQGSYPLNEQMVTKMFRLKYVEVEPIRGALQNLVTRGGDCNPFLPDLLICNDQALNMHRLERIIETLDQPGGADAVHIVQVQYAAAADMADKLTKIFEQKKGQPGQRQGSLTISKPMIGSNGVPIHQDSASTNGQPVEGGGGSSADTSVPVLRLVIPDDRTNKLVIIASDKSFDRVLTIIKDLDVPTAGEGGVHVYYLQNAAAEELSNTLSNLAQGTAGKAPKPPGSKGGSTAELFSGEVKITAEKSTNSLVIIASDTDYRNLVKVIEKLDLARREVFVEAVIMEVNLDNDNKFGARLHTGLPPITTNLFNSPGQTAGIVGDNFGGSGLPPSFSLLNLASFGGFLAGLQGPSIPQLQKLGINIPSFGVLIHALEASNNANVLSTPHILTTDNEEAEITVGQNVPFQSGFSPSSLGSSLGGLAGAAGGAGGLPGGLGSVLGGGLGSFFAPIQRQNVDLKLKIKPQINEGDLIRMVVDEQTEEIASQDPVLGPTTSKRSAKTTIVVRDQQTVVIGGLIQERNIESVNKVPILGDIPLLGHLFREQEHHKIRTNLLLFLTPYIIRDQSDFQRIFERKVKERQQFVEEFYGHEKEYEAYIDYQRKAGPISKMRSQLRAEANKVENGGTGAGTGERAIVPTAKQNPELTSPSARPSSLEGAPPLAPQPTPDIVDHDR